MIKICSIAMALFTLGILSGCVASGYGGYGGYYVSPGYYGSRGYYGSPGNYYGSPGNYYGSPGYYGFPGYYGRGDDNADRGGYYFSERDGGRDNDGDRGDGDH